MNYEEYLKKVLNFKKGEAGPFHKENWNKQYYFDYCIDHGKPKDKIIATFLKERDVAVDNYQQAIFFFNRYNKIAKQLEGFPLYRIKKTIEYLVKSADYKFTLETVGKYLEVDVMNQIGEEPIITLKSGEQVFSVERLKDLESKKKIKYENNKWLEI